MTGRLYASGDLGVPMCLARMPGESIDRVMYGDSKGAVVLLTASYNEMPARDLLFTGETRARPIWPFRPVFRARSAPRRSPALQQAPLISLRLSRAICPVQACVSTFPPPAQTLNPSARPL